MFIVKARLYVICFSQYFSFLYFVYYIRRPIFETYANSFFPSTARLWNSLCAACFHVTYNLNFFKGNVSKHLVSKHLVWCLLTLFL